MPVGASSPGRRDHTGALDVAAGIPGPSRQKMDQHGRSADVPRTIVFTAPRLGDEVSLNARHRSPPGRAPPAGQALAAVLVAYRHAKRRSNPRYPATESNAHRAPTAAG